MFLAPQMKPRKRGAMLSWVGKTAFLDQVKLATSMELCVIEHKVCDKAFS